MQFFLLYLKQRRRSLFCFSVVLHDLYLRIFAVSFAG